MKILYITQYFYPEIGATSNRAFANAKYLSKQGHKVVVLTEMPNHPKGIIFDGYRRKLFVKEKLNGFDVMRVWVYATPNKNFITRLLFYFSFTFFGIIYGILNWKNFDAIYVTSPPLFVGLIGIFLKKLFPKTKFIFEVRDLWPDVAVALNELNNKKFIKLSQHLERKCYTLANKIVAVTKYFKDEIVKKGITSTKIDVVRNGTDIDSWGKSYNKKFVDILGYKDKFIVIYAGNLGVAQGLETIIYAANEVKNQKDILFLFVGDGPIKKQLEQLKDSLKLNNVIFLPAVPSKEICKYLSIANCGIVPLKKSEVFLGTIPSKIFDYLSCELPALLGVDGEARKILEKSKGGLFFEPENHNDLIKNIIYLKDNPDIRKNMGKAGRQFIEKFYNRRSLAKKIEKIILES